MLTSSQIRQQFIDYFTQKHQHQFVPSSPVVPHDDPTLLFTNAGMNQFKDVFLATGTRPYNRAANTQKCIRAGGKHNDLEDVGKDTYHHTFFEMLGNWSLGDYFKEEAIAWAWDLLTNVWGLPKDRIYATVFGGDQADGLEPDTEAEELWKKMTDIDPSHITRWSKKDNFWEMGETGPCGPCSELHIDLTPDGSGASLVNGDDPRVIEIWNLVFIQYNRDVTGKLHSLPAKHVDTGMGFERICTVIQGKTSNYDTDVFMPLFQGIQTVTGMKPYGSSMTDPVDIAYRIIADHIRCLTFALTDGALPSNEGRGYVLRRILRRAIRHGWQTFNIKEPFLYKLVDTVVQTMEGAFPELAKNPEYVASLIRDEEESFGRTLERGIAMFNDAADAASDKTITGKVAFTLHDTFGFPLDLTQIMAEERNMAVDTQGFNTLMEQARNLARAAGGKADVTASLMDVVQKHGPTATRFLGYQSSESNEPNTLVLFKLTNGIYQAASQVAKGDQVAVLLESSTFYAESGGQVGDQGIITNQAGDVLHINDTIKLGDVFFHLGIVESDTFKTLGKPDKQQSFNQSSKQSEPVLLQVDAPRRQKICNNHTTTHMLNRALRKYVNAEADQKGSFVDDEKLRFDFSHHASLTDEQIKQVEENVTADIVADMKVYDQIVPQEQALKIKGLRAVFGEKYPDSVRVVSIGVPVSDLLADPNNEQWPNHSIEFCGGVHLDKTGDAEGFVIIHEEAVAKGVRRIIALTGRLAHQAAAEADMLLARINILQKADIQAVVKNIVDLLRDVEQKQLPALQRAEIRQGINLLQQKVRSHEKQASQKASGNVVEQARQLAEQVQDDLLICQVPDADGKTLRTAMDVIRKKQPNAALMLVAVDETKIAFLASVPKNWQTRGLKAGDWVRDVAKVAGGNGGGRPDMAQAGGKDPSKLPDALEKAAEFVRDSAS